MKDALLAFGMGGPNNIESIEPFLGNMFRDRELINFGMGEIMQNLIAGFIASRRAKKTAEYYKMMGGSSPQLRLTEAFLKKLSVKYEARTRIELDTYPAMCYWHPMIKNTVVRMTSPVHGRQYRRILLFPMYPQYSLTTTGICFSHFRKAVANICLLSPLIEIHNYHLHQPYLDVLANRVHAAALKIGKKTSEVHLLFSAHSVPQSVAERGDPYVAQIREQCIELATMVKPRSYSIAYQSQFDKKRWLSPTVREELESLSTRGERNIVLLAISFINDHMETLIELDEGLIKEGRGLGLNIVRTESLNDADDFVAAIAELLAEV